MPINLDSSFSVYHLVERLHNKDTQLLQDRKTMNTISYEIENATLVDSANTRIFAGFQKMSKFLPQIKRYTRIAQKAEAVYVFGIMDVEVPEIPNIIYVPLEKYFQLAKEWFLVSFGTPFGSALATEELTNIDDPDEQRQFRGVWTFDVSMVAILDEWLNRTVDAQAILLTEDDINRKNQAMLISNIYNRMMKRIGTNTLTPASEPISKLNTQDNLKVVIKETLQPLLYSSKTISW
ncbi:MAG: DICT sensory domain-containing protein [bacterium]|nr:DICT sensory domain-containing protein [bacterium]